MKSGWLLTTVVGLSLAAAAFAGEETGPPVPFPPPEADDFGVLLNWIMTAEPAACEEFLKEASAVADRSGSAEVDAQYRLLNTLAHEQGKISLIWWNFDSYDSIADDLETPPVYAATAACVSRIRTRSRRFARRSDRRAPVRPRDRPGCCGSRRCNARRERPSR